ncbi:hypothetical protein [Vitiosangium sp. GDMCC 1.1324]|uniref:hypothetical protein n=1 Tax=Vitiosangium sp. (strain GDMCC 1.1324) TaxID=2138576 RepID=UPI000D3429B7|nr:hypothetical protein [Vitiosangium sp. GDMCC 1.1324]PTL78812.1 hypothetical protein DAT35_37780 [Vitiosangium sp. GDMCC 1.1324]
MDEKKKPQENWEERAQLGPYQLEEQMPQSPDSPGELYRATHEKSGATALVLKPSAEEDVAGLKDCRVRFICSVAPSYYALEVEDSRGRISVESLLVLFEGVREGVRRMSRAFDDPHESRHRWRLGLAVAGAAVVGVLILSLVHLAHVSPPPGGSNPLANTSPEPMSDEVTTAAWEQATHGGLADTADAGGFVLARPLPSEPFKGQKRPPCTRYAEVELVGACWVPHKLKAPCPDVLYEHQGECYLPAFSAKPPPQSLGQ